MGILFSPLPHNLCSQCVSVASPFVQPIVSFLFLYIFCLHSLEIVQLVGLLPLSRKLCTFCFLWLRSCAGNWFCLVDSKVVHFCLRLLTSCCAGNWNVAVWIHNWRSISIQFWKTYCLYNIIGMFRNSSLPNTNTSNKCKQNISYFLKDYF